MKKKRRAFTLIELLAVIIVLAIILVIAVPNVMASIEEARYNTFKTNEKMLNNAVKNYVLQGNIEEPSVLGNKIKVIYPLVRDVKYIKVIKDPISSEPCFDISYTYVENVGYKNYKYTTALACPNYLSSYGFNLIDDYVFFDKDEDLDGLADGFLFWSSKNDFTPTVENNVQEIRYDVTNKKVTLGIEKISPPSLGDKIYVSATYKGSREMSLGGVFYMEFGNTDIYINLTTDYQRYSDVVDVVNESHKVYLLDNTAIEGDIIYIKDIILINLTDVYGAGNEPTKEEIDKIIKRSRWYN